MSLKFHEQLLDGLQPFNLAFTCIAVSSDDLNDWVDYYGLRSSKTDHQVLQKCEWTWVERLTPTSLYCLTCV